MECNLSLDSAEMLVQTPLILALHLRTFLTPGELAIASEEAFMQLRMTSGTISFSSQILVALVFSIVTSSPIWAQVTGATLSGTVEDASGAKVPQAQISVRNVSTAVSSTAATDSSGFYTVPNLLPGSYEITASASGFATEIRRGITLTVGAEQVLNFTLKVGSVTQTVEIVGAAPIVQLETSNVGDVVASRTVVDLPLNGRDWTQLATLQAGVSVVATQQPLSNSAARVNRGFGDSVTISGTRPQANNYRLDGISIVDYSGGPPGSVLGVALGVDAVEEFSVLTANSSAEYGRTSGGVVNAITKSGTNQIHGDAYWFLRDEDFDARNFFDKQIAPFHRNQFGGSFGGPIQKDKTFFFADYEGFRQALGTTAVDNVPSATARNGIIFNANGTSCTIGVVSPGCALTNSAGTVGVDPKVLPYLPLWPMPNAGLIGTGNTGHYLTVVNAISRENFVTARIDRKFSDKDSIFGTYLYDPGLVESPDALQTVLSSNNSGRQSLALEETHTFSPSLVNSLRVGYSRVSANSSKTLAIINPLAGETSLGAFPGQGPPTISVPGLTGFGGGIGALSTIFHHWNSYQVYDDAFLTKGLHSLKFGFAFERMQDNVLSKQRPDGSFSFPSLTGFLSNQPTTFQGGVAGSYSPRGERASLFGGYLQDDWRWRPNLTLNLGLRYEASTVPSEINGKLENLQSLTAIPPGHLGSPLFNNPTLRNFEPRVGFAWDPFHNGKTAIRGAFGIFDKLPILDEAYQLYTACAPFATFITATGLATGSFPTGAAAVGTILPSTLRYCYAQPNPKRNYVEIWNLNVQRELSPTTTITVGYVGNHGVHMVNRNDSYNLVIPTLTSQGYLWPSPIGSGTLLNPNAGAILGMVWGGTALYDALEVQVTKRISHGFQLQGSYTWAKGIDTGSANTVSDPYTNSISSMLWFCDSCRRGLSDFNIAHRLVVNSIWDVPTPKNWGVVTSHLLGGWEAGGIILAQTGVPFTPLIGGDPLGTRSSDPFGYPDRIKGPGCASPVNPGNPKNYIKLNCFALPIAPSSLLTQCSPFGFPSAPIAGTCANLLGNVRRNSVIGPGLVNVDFSLFKNNYIPRFSETFNVQFRAEFFNILNRANFASPIDNETLFTQAGTPVSGAGAIDMTATTSRQIQFALKVIW